MIWINDDNAPVCEDCRRDATLLKTYTLFLIDNQPTPRFEPLMALTDADALGRARELLDAHPEYETVEVCFGQEVLFRVGRTQDGRRHQG